MSEDYELGTYSRETQICGSTRCTTAYPSSNTPARPAFFHCAVRRAPLQSAKTRLYKPGAMVFYLQAAAVCRDPGAVLMFLRPSPRRSLLMLLRCRFSSAKLLFSDGRYIEAFDGVRRGEGPRRSAYQARSVDRRRSRALRLGDFSHAYADAPAAGSDLSNEAVSLAITPMRCGLGLFEEAEQKFQDALAIQRDNARALHGSRAAWPRATSLNEALEPRRRRSTRIRATRSSTTRLAPCTSACGGTRKPRTPIRATSTCCPTRTAARRPRGRAPKCGSSARSGAAALRSTRQRREAAHRALPRHQRENHRQGDASIADR